MPGKTKRRKQERLTLKGARLTDRKVVERMQMALDGFARSPCTFWACEGPHRPKHMITCSHCWAVRDLSVALAAMERRIRESNELSKRRA